MRRRFREYLRGHGAQGMELPVRAYLTAPRSFEALGDSARSRAVVEEGYHELMQRLTGSAISNGAAPLRKTCRSIERSGINGNSWPVLRA